jgi:hypothetical protein
MPSVILTYEPGTNCVSSSTVAPGGISNLSMPLWLSASCRRVSADSPTPRSFVQKSLIASPIGHVRLGVEPDCGVRSDLRRGPRVPRSVLTRSPNARHCRFLAEVRHESLSMLGCRPDATVRLLRRVFGSDWPLEAHECVSCAVVGVEEVVCFVEPCLLECSERDGVARSLDREQRRFKAATRPVPAPPSTDAGQLWLRCQTWAGFAGAAGVGSSPRRIPRR